MASEDKTTKNVPCANGCGFWGSDERQGLCSKCHRDKIREDAEKAKAGTSSTASPVVAPATPTSSAPATPVLAPVAPASPSLAALPLRAPSVPELVGGAGAGAGSVAGAAGAGVPTPASPAQPKRNRCFQCKRKVGLLGFECRCSHVFCAECRHAEKHSCTADFKSTHRDQLARVNAKADFDKLSDRV